MSRRAISAALPAAVMLFAALSLPAQNNSPASSFSAVKSQIAQGELDTAERTLWTVISSDPNNTAALMLLGTIREHQQRYPEAEALFRRVLQLDPHSTEARKSLGSVLLAQKKDEEAVAVFREVVASAPNDYEMKTQLAQMYVGQSKFREAVTLLDTIPEAKLPVAAISVKAAGLLGMGRTSDASALIARAGRSTISALDLAEVFVESGHADLALRTLMQMPKGTKLPARFYYLRGSAEKLKGDKIAAKKSLTQALALDPKSAPILMALAELAAMQKHYAESVSLLQRAHAADPNSVPVLRHLVEQAMQAGLHGLVEQYSFELEKASSAPDDQYLAAAALLQEREYEEAGRLFENYVAQRSDSSKAFLGLGLAYLNQQRYPEAHKALERALALDPTLVDAEYSLGVLYLKEGDNTKALEYFQRVLKAQPAHAKALLDAGTLYLQMGDLDKATTALQASEKADPTDPSTQYQLSLLYNRTGKPEKARQHMDKFRALKLRTGSAPQAAQ